jgi:osmoprotectant transport system permease protein
VKAALILLASAVAVCAQQPPELRVGSKTFTESVVLGELLAQLGRQGGASVEHLRQLGGTQVLFNALQRGEIDAYPEYTGTLRQEIFAGRSLPDVRDLREALAGLGLAMSAPLGFNNTYVMGMREERSAELGITSISDLREHPDLAFGFSNEFMDRGDGWPALRERYALPQQRVVGLEHNLAYRALESGDIDVTDLYATDAEIEWYGLRSLVDDLGHFPEYDAVLLYRVDLAGRAPDVVAAWADLEGAIPEEEMVAMNARAKLDRVPEPQVAAAFLDRALGVRGQSRQTSRAEQLRRHTLDHLLLVGVSLLAAILLAIPLGIAAARRPRLGQVILGTTGIIQTLPALALLVFMIPLFGIGVRPAIVALFLYSLLPIVRNTHAGLTQIPGPLRESARALGLPAHARLLRVELPLASPSILAGIKTSAVINVGTATLGALIGAGGYGQPILTGIRLDDTALILMGAVPAALLAVAIQLLFEGAERWLVPAGLRRSRAQR